MTTARFDGIVLGTNLAGVDNSDGTITINAPTPSGSSTKIYDYTVAGSDKASIDTAVDGTTVANFSGYDLIEVWMVARTDSAGALAAFDMTVNNDTGNNYDRAYVQGFNGATFAGTSLAQPAWRVSVHGSGGSANYPSSVALTMADPNGTTFLKSCELRETITDATAGNNQVTLWALGYRSTSAVGRIKVAAISPAKFKVGTRLLVYGR